MSDKHIELGSLYEMNQAIIRNQEMSSDITNLDELVKWVFSGVKGSGHKYLMFLCREKNDYTIFRIAGNGDKEEFQRQFTRLMYSRGLPVGINFNKVLGGYEVWIRNMKNKDDVHMYVLFNCNDFVIQIGR